MTSLQGKVAVVTGSTSGIGKASAPALAKAGAKVVLSGRRIETGRAITESIVASGGDAIFVQTDVGYETQIQSLIEQTVAKCGKLDIAFNNADVEGEFGIVTTEQTAEHYQSVFDINVKGV